MSELIVRSCDETSLLLGEGLYDDVTSSDDLPGMTLAEGIMTLEATSRRGWKGKCGPDWPQAYTISGRL